MVAFARGGRWPGADSQIGLQPWAACKTRKSISHLNVILIKLEPGSRRR